MGDESLSWGLTTRQPLWVNLCRLPEKGGREIDKIVEEMKERDRVERKMNENEETGEKFYCDHPLSVVCRQQLICSHSRGHSFDPILMKLAQKFCLYEILVKFDTGSLGVKN